jgi:hypothetical protein
MRISDRGYQSSHISQTRERRIAGTNLDKSAKIVKRSPRHLRFIIGFTRKLKCGFKMRLRRHKVPGSSFEKACDEFAVRPKSSRGACVVLSIGNRSCSLNVSRVKERMGYE